MNKKTELVYIYLFHNRLGSWINLYAHSNERSRIHLGNLFSTPAYVLNAWPRPSKQALSLSLCSAIHFSCLGQPSETKTRSGFASRIFLVILASSFFDNILKGGE